MKQKKSTDRPTSRPRPRGEQEMESKLERVARKVAADLGYEVVEIKYAHGARRGLLRVVLDSDQGVSHDDCARFSNGFGATLDQDASMADSSYTLEVSSPGVFRPFSELKHYTRSLNRKVELQLKEPLEGKHQFKGTLREVDAERLLLVLEDGREQTVPMALVRKATRALEL